MPTMDIPATPQSPRQITRDNIRQLLDSGQLEANPGDGVWRQMVRTCGEWELTGLHRDSGLRIRFKIKNGRKWLYGLIADFIPGHPQQSSGQFDANGVLNRPDIRINAAIDGPTCLRPASEIKEIVAELMKDTSLYSVLHAVESVCIDKMWPRGNNQTEVEWYGTRDAFQEWAEARWMVGKLLDKPVVSRVSKGAATEHPVAAYIRKLRARADRHASLQAALRENPDQPQAAFVAGFHVHPNTVRRCRRELEEAGAIPFLAHRHATRAEEGQAAGPA